MIARRHNAVFCLVGFEGSDKLLGIVSGLNAFSALAECRAAATKWKQEWEQNQHGEGDKDNPNYGSPAFARFSGVAHYLSVQMERSKVPIEIHRTL
jgi:hypothetical protein